MPASIGVNLRVTGHCSQGGRKYMEDFFSVAYQQTEDERDLEYAFFGIYDGHGGGEAATYAKEHLMESIVRQKNFWSDKDEDVLRAIKEGYIATHYAMWKEQANWPKTASGLPSTAGTTATIAFIRHAKIYIGHVGDSGVILGYQESGEIQWKAKQLTKDHKPENASEMYRIQQCGGKVVTKSGVPRVVWNRPRIGHKGPVRRSTPIDEIPFLAVARSLGDLWSYNSACDQFVVSPDPDTCVIPIDTGTFRCLIFGTDGLWNMMSPETAVQIVQTTEKHNECIVFSPNIKQKIWINPSKSLVEHSLERWSTTRMRADNTTAVTLLLDPPGPPRAEVLKNQHKESIEANLQTSSSSINGPSCSVNGAENEAYPPNGLAIVTRYPVDQYLYPDSEPICDPRTNNAAVPCQQPYYTKNSNIIHTTDNTPTSSELPTTKCQPTENITPVKTNQSIESQSSTSIPSSNSNSTETNENIQINEVSSSSPEDNPSEERGGSTNVVNNCKKRYNKIKLFKSKTNIVFTRRCTRSNQDIQTDVRRVRTMSNISSSSDYCKNSNTVDTRKKLRIYRTHLVKDDYRRNTRAMDKLPTVINERSIDRRVTRKRNVIINSAPPVEKKNMNLSNIILKERLSPPSKKVRQVSCCTSTCLNKKSNESEIDCENSDQENESKQTNVPRISRSKSFIQNDKNSFHSRLRTRHPPDIIRSDINENAVASCSYTTCVGRNLRERNSNLPTRHTPSQQDSAVKHGTNNVTITKKYVQKRVIPTKNQVQTRNRVKKFTK